jgi:hypothetical protein
MNQIVDIKCVCMRCETPINIMSLDTRLAEVTLLCYNCHLDRMVK